MLQSVTRLLPLASLAAITLEFSLLSASPAAAGENVFLPPAGCQATTLEGEVSTTVWFQAGRAVNNHGSASRDILCPIPYERMSAVSTSVIVRSVVHDFTNDSGGGIATWICEAAADGSPGGGCPDVATTSPEFRGVTTLEVEFTPNADTRFLYLRVRLPDVDGDGRKSYLAGYRVCRGSC
ncbi:MAG: hypothetical protein ACKVP5_12380 [Aestuariivirga sp.]